MWCIVAQDAESGKIYKFAPHQLDSGLELLQSADKLIGHNILGFDIPVIKKLLESAIANAENNDKADIDLLVVKSVIVNQGMRLKRMKPRARGRADRIIKPTCHIEIILSDQEK